MEKLEWQEELRRAVAELNLSKTEVKFRIHPLYRVGVSSFYSASIDEIFGNSFLGRMRNFGGNLFKFPWPLKAFSAHLPLDSIIFFRETKKGLIASSQKGDFVLKLFSLPANAKLLDEEISTLKEFKRLGVTGVVPEIISDGTTTNGARWMLMKFCSNVNALSNLPDPEVYFLKNSPELLNPLLDLYRKSNPEVISLPDWLERASFRALKHPSFSKIEILLKEIRKFKDRHDLVHTRIHHDIQVNNVLLDKDKHPVFIDWEGEIRGLTLIDFFEFSRRYISANPDAAKKFWEFMRGEESSPKILVDNFDFYRTSAHALNATVSPEAHRSVYLLYALERTLLLYEKRKVNRLEDAKGFEAKILESVK